MLLLTINEISFFDDIGIVIFITEPCHISDFRYHYDQTKIVKTEPLSLGKVVVANQCLKSMVRI